jgi:SAM-dependent methyltransferase
VSRACKNLFDELRAYKRSRALAVALTVGLLDAIGNDSLSASRIASACGLGEDWTCSLMAILADLDLVERHKEDWTLTERGKGAVVDQTLRTFAGYHLHCYEAWQALPERCHGTSTTSGFHRRAMQNPEFVRSYLQSMEAIAQRNLPFLQRECSLSGTVLDVGAGPSTFCRYLASSGQCSVTGLDLPPMVAVAKDLFDYPISFRWVAADFRDYEPGTTFDTVFCSHLLEYASASDLPDWLARLRGFLRPGGTAAFLIFLRGAGSATNPDLDLFELSTGLNGERLGHICTSDEFRAVLRNVGATEIACKALPEGPSYSECLFTCGWTTECDVPRLREGTAVWG